MDLTLNIIERELRSFGHVERTSQENLSFHEFRLFLGSAPLDRLNVLYLCDTRTDVGNAVATGRNVIYVSQSDSRPDDRAVLSVLGGESVLVVFNALLDLALKFGEWEHAMDEIFYGGESLQKLLDISSPFLRNNVVVLDSALKLLAYTKDVPCDDPITVELISHGYHTEENIAKFKLHKRFKPWVEEEGFVINDSYEICNYVTVVKTFKTKTSFSIIIVMMCNVTNPDSYLLDVYDIFASHVENYAKRDYPEDKPSGDAVDTFLKDLFLDSTMSVQSVKERSRFLGLPYEARFCLFYVREAEKDVPQSRLLSDISRLVAPAKTVLVDDAVVVLCFSCRNDSCALHCTANTCPLGQTSLSSRLNDVMNRYGIVCGRSSKFTELSMASVAFRQARIAYDISKKRELCEGRLEISRNWDRITSFDSCSLDFLVEMMPNESDQLVSSTYAGHVLESMYQHDLANKTDNYRFLYEYLMNERRASVVAEKLHMHRNNVKYRIDKIESQYHIDTNDPPLRFDFLLAYRIREALSAQAVG